MWRRKEKKSWYRRVCCTILLSLLCFHVRFSSVRNRTFCPTTRMACTMFLEAEILINLLCDTHKRLSCPFLLVFFARCDTQIDWRSAWLDFTVSRFYLSRKVFTKAGSWRWEISSRNNPAAQCPSERETQQHWTVSLLLPQNSTPSRFFHKSFSSTRLTLKSPRVG